MIEYILQDEDGNQYELSGSGIDRPAKGSVTFSDEQFNFESKTIENSALSGAVKLGKTRLASRFIGLRIERSHPVDSDWRAAENEFIKWLEKTYYLIDSTNNRRLRANIEGISVTYSEGAHKLNSTTKANLKLLDPFWENTTQDDQDEELTVTQNEIDINNQGVVIVYPILTFVAAAAVVSLKIVVEETQEGILIEDILFGTPDNLTMICDCKEGTLKIGNLDRSISIAAGTGYFSFPVGESTLFVTPDVGCDLNIKWRQRQYV